MNLCSEISEGLYFIYISIVLYIYLKINMVHMIIYSKCTFLFLTSCLSLSIFKDISVLLRLYLVMTFCASFRNIISITFLIESALPLSLSLFMDIEIQACRSIYQCRSISVSVSLSLCLSIYLYFYLFLELYFYFSLFFQIVLPIWHTIFTSRFTPIS